MHSVGRPLLEDEFLVHDTIQSGLFGAIAVTNATVGLAAYC
jgi:hypothetical protein